MRYAIQKTDSGAYFSEFAIVGVTDSIESDGTGTKYVHQRHLLKPKFEAFDSMNASKYGSAEDAANAMSHKHLNDPAAFNGCKVVEIES